MSSLFGRLTARSALAVLATALTLSSLAAQTPRAQWPTYGGDLASSRYSPLAQIDASNFGKLEVAWRFKTDNLGPQPEFNLQSTPLVVDGMLYSTGGTRRSVVALDAATGELKWVHAFDDGPRFAAAPRPLSGRGLAYWSSGDDRRILYVTPGYTLIALDARTGQPIGHFGRSGAVDLKQDADQVIDPIESDIGLQAAPIVVNDVIVVGAAHSAGMTPKSRRNEKGYVRGYDVRTGKRLWVFHTIPRPGEEGNETWLNDSWSYTGNTGAWTQMSADETLGLVYVPTESPTNDAYGGHRPGATLFANSIVALDARTGRRAWHFQTTHHDLWDWDLPCAPILADITVEGRRIRALAQLTKQGFVFVLDRTNGRPVWPIEERAVPAGDVPGEWYSPTQPFPTKPPAFERQGVSREDLIDFTPALRAEAEKIVERYRLGPIYTPPVVSKADGPLGMLMLPNTTGGANWPGGSLDPETSVLYVFSNTAVSPLALVHDAKQSDMNFIQGVDADSGGSNRAVTSLSVQGLPLVKPPWGRITAIALNEGSLKWSIAHGDTPDNVRGHAALKDVELPRTGRQGRIGTLVTKTLLIAGEGGFAASGGRRGAMLRAYDKATGQDAGAIFMPAPQTGSPMTYAIDGRQFIVVAVSGGTYSGELLAFRLPRS